MYMLFLSAPLDMVWMISFFDNYKFCLYYIFMLCLILPGNNSEDDCHQFWNLFCVFVASRSARKFLYATSHLFLLPTKKSPCRFTKKCHELHYSDVNNILTLCITTSIIVARYWSRNFSVTPRVIKKIRQLVDWYYLWN